MGNFILDEIIDRFKKGILWILVNVIFTTPELKNEAYCHVYSGEVRIPGVCYGSNLVRGYLAIGRLFPGRCWQVRLDFILGYLKLFILLACSVAFFLLMAKFAS